MGKNKKNRDGIVYSTNPEYEYRYVGEEESDTLPPTKQMLYLSRENRNGTPVVVIKDFIGNADDLKDLEKKLKTHCGVGGSSKDGDIIIQGDNQDKIKIFLQKLGYKTKG
jgi:translation initiation factor 1